MCPWAHFLIYFQASVEMSPYLLTNWFPRFFLFIHCTYYRLICLLFISLFHTRMPAPLKCNLIFFHCCLSPILQTAKLSSFILNYFLKVVKNLFHLELFLCIQDRNLYFSSKERASLLNKSFFTQ